LQKRKIGWSRQKRQNPWSAQTRTHRHGEIRLDQRARLSLGIRGTAPLHACSDRDGKRIRKIFNLLDESKKKALFVAQRIQSGMQHVTEMKPHGRTTT
jgi:hypothetical protein